MAQALGSADALFLADDGDSVVATADALTAAGANLKNIQLLGTGPVGQSAGLCEPGAAGRPLCRAGSFGLPRLFAARYRTKFGGEPVRTATLAYDAVALVAALARTQGPQRFSSETLTNPSGFAGIDGLFRFRPDGTNERGLAVMRVASTGSVAVAGSPKSFGAVRLRAARSATTASSTGNPACVTRRRPLSSTTMAPSSRSTAMRRGSSARPDSAA